MQLTGTLNPGAPLDGMTGGQGADMTRYRGVRRVSIGQGADMLAGCPSLSHCGVL